MKHFYLSAWALLLLTNLVFNDALAQNEQNAITVAGSGGAPGSSERLLNGPQGIFLDAAGNLYIADHFNRRIQKFGPGSSTVATVAPLPGSTLENSAADIFVDPSGVLYISDDLGTRILKYIPGEADGKVIIQASPMPPNNRPTFFSPLGISVDARGNVYITDGTTAQIQKFAPSPAIIFTAGEIVGSTTAGGGDFHDVFVDKNGNIYASEAVGNRILKFTPGSPSAGVVVAGGNGRGSAPNQFDRPEGIFVDTAGNIYVSDFNNNRVQRWAPGATAGVTVAGGNGSGSLGNQLKNPWGVEVDKAGNIYVSDFGNHRVQKFPPRNGLSYKYYEGSWSSLPDFNLLQPVRTGLIANAFSSPALRTAGRTDNFAFLWEGYIKIDIPGTYTFETVSDDGSKLYFNSRYSAGASATVNNDGLHGATSANGTVYIAEAGTYPIAISYFEKDGGESMQAFWSGPGIPRQMIPDEVFTQLPPTAAPPTPAGNLTYKYYEGGFSLMPDFSSLSPLKTGTSSNFDIGIHRPGVTDSFAIVWDGFINIPAAGSYTFETISDDGSQLFFNGSLLVDNDGLHPPKSAYGTVNVAAPGRYPIKVQYFETYGAESFQVFWSGPGISRQLIPDPAFAEAAMPPSTGLNYKYYHGDFNSLPDFNALAPLRTGITNNVDINQRNPGVNDFFAFVWQGYINLPTAGTYTFETVSDDGSKVYFNTPYSAGGGSTVNNDGLHPAVSASGTVTVPGPGAYPITITYFEKSSGQVMELYWTGPGISRQLIPDAVFSPTGTPPPAGSGGLGYKYYEGDFDLLPDFNVLNPVKSGTSGNIDIGIRTPGTNDHFAFLWQGYINIPTAGVYTFETVSDDGSKLYFNSTYNSAAVPTVNNDGLHAAGSATGAANIASAGWYPITISFFEKNGGESMQVYWSGPGISRQLIPDLAFAQSPPAALATLLNSNSSSSTTTQPLLAAGSIYPNPFRESFNVEFYNPAVNSKIQVSIYDLRGRLLYKKNAGNMPRGNVTLQVKPGDKLLLPGVYIARLQVEGIPTKLVKLVKAK